MVRLLLTKTAVALQLPQMNIASFDTDADATRLPPRFAVAAYGTTSLALKSFVPATALSVLPRTFATVQVRLGAAHGCPVNVLVWERTSDSSVSLRVAVSAPPARELTALSTRLSLCAQAGSMGSSLLAGEETPGWLAVGSLGAAVAATVYITGLAKEALADFEEEDSKTM